MMIADEDFEKQAYEVLKSVIDPEIRVDLVSLGLIYGVACDEAGLHSHDDTNHDGCR